MIEAHIPLIRSVARQIHRRLPPSFELDDLVQSGVLGLIQAAEHYDAAGGASFDTFARHRVRGAILDSVRRHEYANQSHVRLQDVPYHDPIEERIAAREEADQVARAVDHLQDRDRKVIEMRYGQQMTLVEVGSALQVKKTRAIQLEQRAIGTLQRRLLKAA